MFCTELSEDYLNLFRGQNRPNFEDEAYRYAKMGISRYLEQLGSNSVTFGFPEYTPQELADLDIVDFRPVSRSISDHRAESIRLISTFNRNQRFVFEEIMLSVDNHDPHQNNSFFVDAFAGAGKTYLLNAIIHTVKGKGLNVVSCAFTGIAASLLLDGKAAHSTFRIPLNIVETSRCGLKTGMPQHVLIKNSNIIIWDECTMVSHSIINLIDKYLRDATGNQHIIFGGKTIVFVGDWRQILPVVKLGSNANQVRSIFKNWRHWSEIRQLRLDENMRTGQNQIQFSSWLKDLGEGKNLHGCTHNRLTNKAVAIPQQCLVANESELIKKVFGVGNIDVNNVDSFKNKAILCPKNVDALRINELILNKIPGETTTYISSDELVSEDHDDDENLINYPIEFLNSLTPFGLPPHKLNLKVGSVIMLLRNLFVASGLCNGQRLIVRELKDNLIRASILVGQYAGSDVWIPRINMDSDRKDLPFKMSRRQFPVRLFFSMTVNKAQGQTLERVGINLASPVFAHGQLYVAFSRATAQSNVTCLVPDSYQQGHLCARDTCINKVVALNEVIQNIF